MTTDIVLIVGGPLNPYLWAPPKAIFAWVAAGALCSAGGFIALVIGKDCREED